MSVINQVLQDLDRRRAAAPALPTLARSVHAPSPHARYGRFARGAGTALAAATGVALAFIAVFVWQTATAPIVATPPLAEGGPLQSMRQPAPPVQQTVTPWVPPPVSPVIVAPPTEEATPLAASQAAPVVTAPVAPPSPTLADTGASNDTRIDTRTDTRIGARDDTHDDPAADARNAARAPRITTPGPATKSSTVATAPPADGPPSSAALSSPPVATAPRPVAASTPPARAAVDASVEKRARPLSAHERADAEYQRGLALHAQGDAAAAEAAFAAAVREDAQHAAARQALAVALVAGAHFEDADKLLTQGLQLDPHDAALAAVLARIQAERHDLGKAVATLRTALADPAGEGVVNHPQERALLAVLLQKSGDHAGAVTSFSAALAQVPDNGAWWIGLGVSLAADGRGARAREAFERARATGTLSPELDLYVEQRLHNSGR